MPQKGTTDYSAFRLPPLHEWVTCERDDVNEGLTRPLEVKVLVNPPRADIFALARQVDAHFAAVRARYDRIRAEREQAVKDGTEPPPLFDPDRDMEDERALLGIVAPRIVAWNVEALNERGEVVDLPPPAEIGGVVADLLSNKQRQWLLQLVQTAHLGGDTRSKLSRRPAATANTEDAKTPSGPQIVDIPTGDQPRSRRKSS